MDRAGIVDEILLRCKSLLVGVLDDSALSSASAASLAIFEKFRDVGHAILQAWVDERFTSFAKACPEQCPCGSPSLNLVHTRQVMVKTLFGEIVFSYRTFCCSACGAHVRPDDDPLGIPEQGTFSDDVRAHYQPLAVELVHPGNAYGSSSDKYLP
jgi:hypothetical protein